MNRGQASAKAKRPRKSAPKRGAFKLTPARRKASRAERDIAASASDVTHAAREAFSNDSEFPTDESFMRM